MDPHASSFPVDSEMRCCLNTCAQTQQISMNHLCGKLYAVGLVVLYQRCTAMINTDKKMLGVIKPTAFPGSLRKFGCARVRLD